MTECLGGTTLKAHDHKLSGNTREMARLSSAGQPYVGTDSRVVDMDGRDVEPGEIGEILLINTGDDEGLLEQSCGQRLRKHCVTAGCTPATSAVSTTTVSSSSSTARRT